MTESSTKPEYVGRYAPSPTGALHFGSLIAAVGSYLQARSHKGRWLLRIEDIDPPREMEGASDSILRTLEAYGFEWDGPVIYQSRREDYYLDALTRLENAGLLYACRCSRKEIIERTGGSLIYPGICRVAHHAPNRPHSLRIIVPDRTLSYGDTVQGPISHNLLHQTGDFVLRRKDGLYAYQLAVSVDDLEQGITEVVRGSDLLDSTPAQIYLIEQLGGRPPSYVHLPIAVNAAGEKLSKQTHARPLPLDPVPTLCQALVFLGQTPPKELETASLDAFWRWATEHWNSDAVPRVNAQLPICTGCLNG